MLSIDSNILIYAFDTLDAPKQARAIDLIARAMTVRTVVSHQVIGEFLNVCRKRVEIGLAVGRAQVEDWSPFFSYVPAQTEDLLDAAGLSARNGKQFWDMLIVAVSARVGASVLFTEDIGDGEIIKGVRIVNPFYPANTGIIDRMLIPSF